MNEDRPEYAKQTRQLIVAANWSALVIVIAAALALVWLAPDSSLSDTALVLLSTIGGMVVKNISTVVDCVFGGSDKAG